MVGAPHFWYSLSLSIYRFMCLSLFVYSILWVACPPILFSAVSQIKNNGKHSGQIVREGPCSNHRKKQTLFPFGVVEARSEKEKRRGGQRWIDHVPDLSVQCVLRSDQIRSNGYRLETSVVTRISANTTSISNNKSEWRNDQFLISLTRNSDETLWGKSVKTKPSNTKIH